jgi:hypothetical protein
MDVSSNGLSNFLNQCWPSLSFCVPFAKSRTLELNWQAAQATPPSRIRPGIRPESSEGLEPDTGQRSECIVFNRLTHTGKRPAWADSWARWSNRNDLLMQQFCRRVLNNLVILGFIKSAAISSVRFTDIDSLSGSA